MKKLLVLIITIMVIYPVCKVFAQPTSQAEADEMAQKLMHMTPAQVMKFRDSMMKAVMNKQAKALPNGKQLLLEHHYDTTYTTVRFNYTRNESQHTTKMGGHSTIIVYGKSAKAAMLYEGNGHTVIMCSLNPPKANTAPLDQAAKSLNKNLKYMPANKQTEAVNTARMAAFGSMTVNNNSLTGLASETGLYSGDQANTIISTKPPVINLGFSFDYDPVEGFSTIAVGGTYHRHTDGSYVDEFKHLQHGSSDDVASAGMGSATDPAMAHITGAASPQKTDPDAAYIKVTKTARGFNIKWTKRTTQPEVNGVTTEELNADIGEPEQQFEAMIHPMPDSKYERWLPKGPKVDGTDDTKGDDSARFYVEVHDKNNPNKLYPGTYSVKYQLKDITHYKGITSNYPVYNGQEEADFKISDSIKYFSPGTFDQASVTDSTATSMPDKGNIAILRLMCLDYGAWTKLTAEVTLDDGSVIMASPYYDTGETFITVPFDRDENKIADAWEKHEKILGKGYGLDWDEDVKPDNGHPGDGIALLDEYRGFLIEDDSYQPVFKRFSPQKKELITIGLANLTANGATYKKAIKDGAMGYGQASDLVIYHFTNSKYGYHEDGVSGANYGRWTNYNSPLKHSHGVVIYADDNRTTDPAFAKALATTFPIFNLGRAGYLGGQSPEETKEVHLWTVYIINDVPFKPTEFMPDHPEGMSDPFEQRMFSNIAAANAEFHVNIDPNHASPLVTQNLAANIQHIVSYSVSHELGHATGIHHHNASNPGPNEINFYKNNPNCVMRYWMDNKEPVNCLTWMQMWIFGLWNPASMITPHGGADYIKLCKGGDDCFHQMNLKKL